LDAIVNNILDGLSEMEAIYGDQFIIDGVEHYNDRVSKSYTEAICGSIRPKGKS
jgi:hypothetical protein